MMRVCLKMGDGPPMMKKNMNFKAFSRIFKRVRRSVFMCSKNNPGWEMTQIPGKRLIFWRCFGIVRDVKPGEATISFPALHEVVQWCLRLCWLV